MVSEDEVTKLANLSRLEIEPDFIPILTSQLNQMLAYVEILNSVDTSSVPALSHVHGSKNVFRVDRMVQGQEPISEDGTPGMRGMFELEEALQNAPEKVGRFLKSPLVIE